MTKKKRNFLSEAEKELITLYADFLNFTPKQKHKVWKYFRKLIAKFDGEPEVQQLFLRIKDVFFNVRSGGCK